MGSITINGITFEGNSVIVSNGTVYIDGKLQKTLDKNVQRIEIKGMVKNVQSDLSISCEDVKGNVEARGSVNCGDVGGSVSAHGSVNCGDIGGNVDAGGSVNADRVLGKVK